MKTVAVYNIKGGVGKTAISVNLAHFAASAKHPTLMWDLDEQGGASAILGHRMATGARKVRRTYEIKDHIENCAWDGIDLVPADSLVHLLDRHDRPAHLRELLAHVGDRYDYVILDCPPTLGIASDQILELADLIVVPLIPSPLSYAAYEQLRTRAEEFGGSRPSFLPVHSMVDRRRRSHREALAGEAGWPVIPYSSAMERSAAERLPIAVMARGSPAAQSMDGLWSQIERHFNERDNPASRR